MKIHGSTALVTGAARGLGREFAVQLLARGAAKVYATARRPDAIDLPGVIPLTLDVTSGDSVRAAADVAGDVSVLVNNAGISSANDLVSGDLDQIRAMMETHFFGALRTTRAFAPILGDNGGGAILNVLSVLSWTSHAGLNGYAAAKSAAWALTNGVRLELAEQGTQVTGLVLGSAATEAFTESAGPYDTTSVNTPADVVAAALDGIQTGAKEVVVDDISRRAKAALAGEPTPYALL